MDGIAQSIQVPPNFDPWNQNFTLAVSDGYGEWLAVPVNMKSLDDYRIYGFRLAISYGTGFGVSLMLLVVLLLLTKVEKRKSFIFFLNAACLLTNTIRCLLFCTWVTGNFYDPYTVLSGNRSRLTSADFASFITINIFGVIVTILVFMSLSLQVWIVCVTTPPLQRSIIMGTTTVMACIALGFRLAAVYLSTKLTLNALDTDSILVLIAVSYILQAVSIWMFSCVFTYKLGHAIIQRRRLNMPQFGPMQIVFIMGCQTMFVPAIFASLQFANILPEIVAHVLTMICIFLPFSAIWAGVVNDQNLATRGPDAHQRLIRSDFHDKSAPSTLSESSTVCEKSRQMSSWSDMKSKDYESLITTPTSHIHNKSIDENCIRVDRKFGFSREDATDQV
ncbi:pheromone receptor [Alternaria alternata]|nr:pheromone receptor [Alternaria alternata]